MLWPMAGKARSPNGTVLCRQFHRKVNQNTTPTRTKTGPCGRGFPIPGNRRIMPLQRAPNTGTIPVLGGLGLNALHGPCVTPIWPCRHKSHDRDNDKYLLAAQEAIRHPSKIVNPTPSDNLYPRGAEYAIYETSS